MAGWIGPPMIAHQAAPWGCPVTLMLTSEEVERALDMRDCVAVLEEAYADLMSGAATPGLRASVSAPASQPGALYDLTTMCSVLHRRHVAAVRLHSDLVTYVRHEDSGERRKIPAASGERWVGLILLFSTRTGEPLAILPDGVVQRARVAATSAVALRRLARADSMDLAIIGSGWQAGAQAAAALTVRDFHRVRVFSPNRVHRERFCSVFAQKLRVPFLPVESPNQAAEGADVVLCATNSMSPVLPPESLRPGMHVGFIRVAEAGERVLSNADLVIRHTAAEETAVSQMPLAVDPDTVWADHQWNLSLQGRLRGFPDLGDLLAGRTQGRTSPDQVTCFVNNIGIGLQFAAVGHVVWQVARELGIGRELPTEWFTQPVPS